MDIVKVVDSDGRNMRYAINDYDNPEEASEIGINVGVPDLSRIDWQEASIELYNKLDSMGLYTIDDVAQKEGALSSAILFIFKRKIVRLYKE